jgi:hypothetical protein
MYSQLGGSIVLICKKMYQINDMKMGQPQTFRFGKKKVYVKKIGARGPI